MPFTSPKYGHESVEVLLGQFMTYTYPHLEVCGNKGYRVVDDTMRGPWCPTQIGAVERWGVFTDRISWTTEELVVRARALMTRADGLIHRVQNALEVINSHEPSV